MENLRIEDLGLSNRAFNCLNRAKIVFAEELFDYTEEDLCKIRNLGTQSAEEIILKIRDYKENRDLFQSKAQKKIIDDESISVSDEEENVYLLRYLEDNDITIDALEYISPKAYNLLGMNGYSSLKDIVFMTADELMNISMMDIKTAENIVFHCRMYIEEIKKTVLGDYIKTKKEDSKDNIIGNPDNKEKILNYVRSNDISIDKTTLSARAKNRLAFAHYNMLSDVIFVTRETLSSIRAAGKQVVDEIIEYRDKYLNSHMDRIGAYCTGDMSALLSDDVIKITILNLYNANNFGGYSFQEFKTSLKLGDKIEDTRLKQIIGQLLADKELEYVDFRCFRKYKSFGEVAAECPGLKEQHADIVRKRMNGKTLEELGEEYGLSRERIRQILDKARQKIVAYSLSKYGTEIFDEDYYRYFYKKYYIDKKDAKEWLGFSDDIIKYLELADGKQGKEDINEALYDTENLDHGFRLKIKNYLNRNKIFIDETWVEKKRSDIEDYVIRKFCCDCVTYDEFVNIYNNFLMQEGIEFDEKIYLTDSVRNTRYNRIPEGRNVLKSQGEIIRYYDIDGRDYEELYSELNLDSYENIEYSTLKFFRDYPELMRKYDIRDHYELHNLLNKTIDKERFSNIVFGKMPMIKFGEFDRYQALIDLLYEYSPISTKDFSKIINELFGYDEGVIQGTYLKPMNVYYHNGVYSVEQKAMSPANMKILSDALTENFYYLSEVRDIYAKLLPNADLEVVNPYNLKMMGFTVLSKYILKNHSTLESYMESLLTSKDVMDITQIKKKMSYNIYMDYRRELKVVEFEPNMLISRRKLEEMGITLDKIKDFCDDVYDFVEDNTYFSIQSIKQAGFRSELFEQGFYDLFYANLLLSDDRFKIVQMFSNKIIYKGDADISIKSFETAVVQEYGSIDLYDFMTEMQEVYGCQIKDKLELVYKLNGSVVYYDKHLDRLYANKAMYYKELGVEG